jgi:predicted transcriptional regulator
METLFRFNVVREPRRSDDEVDPIDLAADTQFQQDAAAIGGGANRRARLRVLAQTFIASPRFVGAVTANVDLERLDRIASAVDALIESGQTTRADVDNALQGILGQSPSDFLATPSLADDIEDVGDSILAIKLSPADHHRPIRRLAAVLRAYHLTQRFVAEPGFPLDTSELVAAQRRALRLAAAVVTAPKPPGRPPGPTDPRERLRDLAKVHDRLTAAIAELRGIRPAGYATVPQASIKGALPPAKFRPINLFETEQAVRLASLKATVLSSGSTVEGAADGGESPTDVTAVSAASPFLTSGQLMGEKPGLTFGRGARVALMGRPDFDPVMPGVAGLRLSQATQQALSQETGAVLTEHALDPAEPIARTIEKLTTERRRVYEQAQTIVRPLALKTFRRIGSTAVAIATSRVPGVFSMSPGEIVDALPDPPTDPADGVPTTHADIRPSGIMDLLLVKQQLKRYETAEISHIANMLKGESTERIHRTRLETETILTTEVERTVATEQELETTDRFEMRRESETALQEETAAKGSLTVKGKYGPTVEFQASGEASWQRKGQESERAASEVAREVTQRASEKVTERVLRRETLRVNRQTEETNQHAFDNKTGQTNISGVYQWLTKVYEAQVFNYGPRTVYDIMIPEPGAFLLEAFSRRRTAAVHLEKPPDFDLTPDQLNEDNYQTYVTLYGATDVKPLPAPFVTESYDFNTGGEDEDQEFTTSTRIQVPDGYQAVRGAVGQVVAVWDDWAVDIVVGQRSHRFSGGGWVWLTDLDEETGSVPFAMVTDKVGDVAIAVEVTCAATERALDLWRADTHAKLVDAHRARLSEYEAKLAELEAQAPAEVVSGSEARNRNLMQDEVKRACISVLTEQHYDHFDAVRMGAYDLPEIDFVESGAEGSYVRFFEQAFEWENLSWVTYPYFWGRKKAWLDKVAIEDDDRDFQDFLKAGYARVQIPIRPGFEEALDHFRVFGDPWLGGSLPAVSDDLYLPIAEELAERLDRPGDEVPVGDPWDVRVPTTLVKLRPDDTLPEWRKQADGSWVEA